MHHAHESRLNYIHLSTCWMSLGRLVKQRPAERRGWLQKNAESLEPLVQHTVRAAVAGEIGAWGLANVAYGAACSCRGEWLGALFASLARAAGQRMSETEFNAQGLANTAWAFATVGQPDAPLFTALARDAKRHEGVFSAEDLAPTA